MWILLSIEVLRVAGIVSKAACIKYHIIPNMTFELLLKMMGLKCLVHINCRIIFSTETGRPR